MSLQSQINALATRIANFLRDDVLPRLLPSGGTTGQVATRTASGYAWQTPATGSVSVQTVEINFTDPARSKTFDVAAVCTAGQKVMASPSLDMPAGVSADELEMDPITVAAHAVATNVVRITASSASLVFGKRNINLVFG